MYRQLLRNREVRLGLLLGLISRAPSFAVGVLVTLHVATELGLDYSYAGFATAVVTVASMIAAPLRGAMVDRRGIRRTIYPSLVIVTVCWGIAPFMPYWPMVVLLGVGALWQYPVYTLPRQIMMAATTKQNRKTALSLDAVAVEVAYMSGPILGITAGTAWSTKGAIAVAVALMGIGAAGFAWANPRLIAADEDEHPSSDLEAPVASLHTPTMRSRRALRPGWLTPSVAGLLAGSIAGGFTIGANELSAVAAMRHFNTQGMIGFALAMAGLGSAMGGIVHGSIHRRVQAPILLILVSLGTGVSGLGHNAWQVVLLMWFCGIFYAPFVASTVEQLSYQVRPRERGKVLGFQGACMSVGIAVAAPLVGSIIDAWGWQFGYLAATVGGVGATLVILLLRRAYRATRR